jgi:hypothetical protein
VREKLKRWWLSKLKIILIIQICLIKVQTFGSLSPLGEIVAVEKAMDAMTEANQTRTQYETHLADAWALNLAISSSNNWENQERAMNFELIRWIDKGIDSLDMSERNDIEALAKTCVFANGPAVYKARSLWSNYEPDAIFDDRIYCIATANKGGSQSDNVDSLMLAESGIVLNTLNENGETKNDVKQIGIVAKFNLVSIYPNPASNEIIVTHDCNSQGVFKLFNSVGQIILSEKLIINSTKIKLPKLAQGVYNYKCEFDSCEKMVGKITIVQ